MPSLSEGFVIVGFMRVTVDSSAGRSTPIDLQMLRARLRIIGEEQVFYMLDEALEALPPAALQRIVGRYISLDDVRAAPAASKPTLLEGVRAFDAAARAGDYYESFNVNSKNYMDKSPGTRSSRCGERLANSVHRCRRACLATTLLAFVTDLRVAAHILEHLGLTCDAVRSRPHALRPMIQPPSSTSAPERSRLATAATMPNAILRRILVVRVL